MFKDLIDLKITDPVMEFVDRKVKPLGSLSLDMSKQCYNFFFILAFSFVWANMKSPKLKHIISVVCGLVVVLLDFGLIPTLFLLAVEISTWAILLLKKAREHPVFVMACAFFIDFLTLLYYYLKDYGEWRMDIATPIMLYVQKSSSLVWNLYDYQHRNDDSARKLSNHLKNNALEELPSFFHFMSYMLFPVTINLGPAVEFRMYMESVNSIQIPQGNKRFRWVGENILLSLLFLTYYVFPTKWDFIHQPEKKSAHGLPYRVVFTWLKIHWCRYRYYSPWCLTNAFVIICGIGYEDGSWEHAINLFTGRVEFARRCRDFIANWNCGTQRFLKYYVYVRGPISPSGRVRPMMMYVTNLVSAVWHGWYGGYLVCFGTVVATSFIEKWYYAVFPLSGREEYKPYGQILTDGKREEKKRLRKEKKDNEVDRRDALEKEKEEANEDVEGKEEKLENRGESEDNTNKKSEGKRKGSGRGVGFYARAFGEWLVLQAIVDYGSSAFFVLTIDNVKLLYGYVDYCGTVVIGGLFIGFFVLSFFTGKKKRKGSNNE